MGIVYQLTFFLALGLLATVVAIFVFAVSLLGRAMEAAARVERDIIAERKENNRKEMATLRKEMKKAEQKGEIPKELRRKLEKLEDKDQNFNKELGRIRKAPELLTVKGGVIHPGIFLFISLVLSSTAFYLSTIKDFNSLIPLFVWVLGIAAIGYGVYRICKSLKVIENVAITSEEAWIAKTVEAFKIAQKELEEEKKPELGLMWKELETPFHIKADSTLKLVFGVHLETGKVADNVMAVFYLPPGFDFPGLKTLIQPDDIPVISKFITARVDYTAPIIIGAYTANEVIIKVPPVTGKYTAYYRVSCRGGRGQLKEFEIIVE